MPVAIKEKRLEGLVTLTEEDLAALVEGGQVPEEGDGGRDGGRFFDRGGDRPSPHREWPLVPAIVVAVLIGALLTFLGMLTQIWANLAGSQLPGS